MTLADFWFCLIALLWSGYFLLEGFDFGVGMLLPVLGRDDVGRRVLINTIGPVWDANEVWVLVAGAAIFAAFPYWYATLFSGFYLALLIVLLALIVRGVAFEYRGKVDDPRWRARWDAAIVAGSGVPALLWGVAFANVVRGVPIDRDGDYTGSLLTLLNPYALLGGLVTLALFLTHGAVFLTLRTTGGVRGEARALAGRVGLVAAALAVAFLVWTELAYGDGWSALLAAGAAACLVGALLANRRGAEGRAFALTGGAVVLATWSLFAAVYPDVLPSTTDPAFSLTVENASSSGYTLRVMSWVAVVMTPFVLAYQAWTYWVFRARIGRGSIPLAAAGGPAAPAPPPPPTPPATAAPPAPAVRSRRLTPRRTVR